MPKVSKTLIRRLIVEELAKRDLEKVDKNLERIGLPKSGLGDNLYNKLIKKIESDKRLMKKVRSNNFELEDFVDALENSSSPGQTAEEPKKTTSSKSSGADKKSKGPAPPKPPPLPPQKQDQGRKPKQKEKHSHPLKNEWEKKHAAGGFEVVSKSNGKEYGATFLYHNGPGKRSYKTDKATQGYLTVKTARGFSVIINMQGEVIGFITPDRVRHFHKPGNGFGKMEDEIKSGYKIKTKSYYSDNLLKLKSPYKKLY